MCAHSWRRWAALLIVLLMAGVLLVGWGYWRYRRVAASPGALPTPLAQAQAPALAVAFDFPLAPGAFGPYIPYETGTLPVDTRFDVQNPGVGSEGKCFVNRAGERVAFNQLYHAGEDWFAYDSKGQVDGQRGAGAAVYAVANGVVTWAQALGSEGAVLIVAHHLPDGARVWSVYWHIAEVQAAVGEAVSLGQPLGVIHDRGFNSHLHWEIRIFADGAALFPADSAGGRGACNGYVAGVGYTWDDDAARAHPAAWGYLDPSGYIAQLQGAAQTP